jgi:hypothetical protein
MTEGVGHYFITQNMWTVSKSSDGGTVGMTETMMPQRGGGGQGSVRGDMVGGSCCRYGVEVARTIAAKNHVLGPKGIKLYGTRIITCKLTDREKIVNKRWNN